MPDILVGVDSHGGWGFNTEYYWWVHFPEDTEEITPEDLRQHSFFKPFCITDLYSTNGSAVAESIDVRRKLLAEALPATSRATGRNETSLTFNDNIDLMLKKSGWPADRPDGNWLHGDFKDVAYPFLHQFYEDMVSKGGLQ